MNERIKQLAVQAGMNIVDDKFSTYGKFAEKFAQLIVQDVLNEVLQAMDDGQDVYYTVADKFRS